jgi:putative FmdB family regulatory protein
MPVYEYVCATCGEQFECSLKLADNQLERRAGCSNSACKPEKKLSRFYGHTVRSWSNSKVEAQMVPKIEPKITTNDPVHVCAKYCSLHKGST